MGTGASLFLIASGAILVFAVNATVQGLDLVAVGWILMAVGLVGLVLSIVFWNSWGGFGRTTNERHDTTIERDRVL
jgi:hypothetical protein